MPSQWDNLPALHKMADSQVPVEQRVFKNGSYFRPPFVQPYRCRNILIDSVTIINSPFWAITPDLCENVTVSNITVRSHGPNNDGCNPESCKNVLISNCYFDTGDDCIAIKSGRNADGRRVNVPSQNIIIRNCRMKAGHGGVVIGSEISGGIRNVFAEDCVMDSPDLLCGLRIKTNSSRGGFVENIFFRNIRIGTVGDVVRVNYYYAEGDVGEFTPSVRNIRIENVTSEKSVHGLSLRGYSRSPVTDIFLENCTFDSVAKGNVFINVKHVEATNVTVNGQPLQDIEDEMIPQPVLTTLESHLNGAHVRQVNKYSGSESPTYQFQLQNGEKRDTVLIANDGKVLINQ
jgi:polygalacturonase